MSAAAGFIEHGHARGVSALIVDAEADIDVPQIEVHLISGGRVHFFVSSHLGAERASAVSRYVRGVGLVDHLSACIVPGLYIRHSLLADNTTMRVTDAAIGGIGGRFCDERVASVSVHCWPGSRVLHQLESLPAPRGRYFVLDAEDIGHAKVYARSAAKSWAIVATYPLNDLEQAEFAEMAAPSPRKR